MVQNERAFAIRDVATHKYLQFDMEGFAIATVPEAMKGWRTLSRAVADHMLHFTQHSLSHRNVVAGRPVEIVALEIHHG